MMVENKNLIEPSMTVYVLKVEILLFFILFLYSCCQSDLKG